MGTPNEDGDALTNPGALQFKPAAVEPPGQDLLPPLSSFPAGGLLSQLQPPHFLQDPPSALPYAEAPADPELPNHLQLLQTAPPQPADDLYASALHPGAMTMQEDYDAHAGPSSQAPMGLESCYALPAYAEAHIGQHSSMYYPYAPPSSRAFLPPAGHYGEAVYAGFHPAGPPEPPTGPGHMFGVQQAMSYAERGQAAGGYATPMQASIDHFRMERQLREAENKELQEHFDVDGQGAAGFVREGLECLVCGDTAACQHYGVRSCEGCKGFFKRSIQRAAKYTCLQNGTCVIDKKRRNRCQHCRFKKCLSVGMVREVVRTESLKGRRGRLSSKAKGAASDAGLPPSVTLLSMLNRVHDMCQPLARRQVKLEEHSNEVGDPWTRVLRVLTESMNALQVDFASRLPGFDKYSESDQRRLLQIHGLDLLTLRLAHRLGPGLPVLVMENGEVLSEWELRACGLERWAAAVHELSGRLGALLREDESAFAGLAALTLLNYKPDVDGVHLRSAGDAYALHHRLIEVLKSHCCAAPSTTQATAQPVLPGPSDPTYFSRLLQAKEEARKMTLELLLAPLSARLDGCPNWLQQAMLMNRVIALPFQ